MHAAILAAVLSSVCTAIIVAVISSPADQGSQPGVNGLDLDARLRRLETSVARQPGRQLRQPSTIEEAGPSRKAQGLPSREQALAELAKLDQQFMSQPVAQAWAGKTETLIRDAFSSDEAVRMGVVAPLDAQIHCRSTSCRIEAIYPSEGAASDAAQMLQLDIGGTLPQTQTMTLQKPDGSSQLVVYAYTAAPQTSSRTRPRG